jgi:caffeoyl-CoA O-methyltransferase
MKEGLVLRVMTACLALSMVRPSAEVRSQASGADRDLDVRVKRFLENHAGQWHDLNVPENDGRILYDLILKNRYKSALEIGTSTGRSSIWIAWALSKTGGKLLTIEIDESRYRTALRNFEESGLAGYIDARLADAHQLVPELKGPFDFVFCDADKEWYKKYFTAVSPKLGVGGSFAAHNVSDGQRRYGTSEGARVFLNYVKSLSNFETRIDDSGGGVSISLKKSDR